MTDLDREFNSTNVFAQVRETLLSPILVTYAIFIRQHIESSISQYKKDPEEARFAHMSASDVFDELRTNGPLETRKYADDVHQILHAIYRACEKLLSEF